MSYNVKKVHILVSESISDHFARVLVVYNHMKRYEEKMEKTCVVENIPCLLQRKSHYMVVAIEKS